MAARPVSRIRNWLLSSPPAEWALNQLRELLIGALRQGPIPRHVAFVMDGNRRFAKNHRIETVEGHNLGFEALARVGRSTLLRLGTSADMLLDTRSVLQGRCHSRYHLRIQH